MNMWEKPPKPTTIADAIQYHQEKDSCEICKLGEWDCPQHPYSPHNEPRFRSAVYDNSYYIAYVQGVLVLVDSNGMARNGQRAERYALVLASTPREAKAKFERGEVEAWID